jgi:hypothetical protein
MPRKIAVSAYDATASNPYEASPSPPAFQKMTSPAAPRPIVCAPARAMKRPKTLPRRMARRATGWEYSISAAPRSGASWRTPIVSAVTGTRRTTRLASDVAVRAKSSKPPPPERT